MSVVAGFRHPGVKLALGQPVGLKRHADEPFRTWRNSRLPQRKGANGTLTEKAISSVAAYLEAQPLATQPAAKWMATRGAETTCEKTIRAYWQQSINRACAGVGGCEYSFGVVDQLNGRAGRIPRCILTSRQYMRVP